MKILSRAGATLYESRHNSMKAVVEAAVNARAYLARANLAWAYLAGANLTRANLTGANLAWAIMPTPDEMQPLYDMLDEIQERAR